MKYFDKFMGGHKVYYYKSFKIVKWHKQNPLFPAVTVYKENEEVPCGFASSVPTAIEFIKEGNFKVDK